MKRSHNQNAEVLYITSPNSYCNANYIPCVVIIVPIVIHYIVYSIVPCVFTGISCLIITLISHASGDIIA